MSEIIARYESDTMALLLHKEHGAYVLTGWDVDGEHVQETFRTLQGAREYIQGLSTEHRCRTWHCEAPIKDKARAYCMTCDPSGEKSHAFVAYLRSLPRPADPYTRD